MVRIDMSAVVLVILGLAGFAASMENGYIEDTDRFPGWKGELPVIHEAVHERGDSVGYGELGQVSACKRPGVASLQRFSPAKIL
jgi:hypothetical protein